MITWTITSMESQPSTGIVVSANWLCTGEDSGFIASLSGASVFNTPNGGYVPYPNLTQDDVLNWVWASGGVNKAETEVIVNSSLQSQINPVVVVQPLPWNN